MTTNSPTTGTAGYRSELEERQAPLLREQVSFVAAHSPYWAKRFADAGIDPESIRTVDDLYRCPTLTKRDYIAALDADRQNYGGLLTGDVREIATAGASIYRTTGTSGMQGSFINTDEGLGIYGRQGLELIRQAGGGPGDTIMLAFPLSFWAAGWGLYLGAKQGHVTVVPAGAPMDTAQRIDILKDYRPEIVAMTPSYAVTFGMALREAGVDPADYGVRGLLLGGETFSESKRSRIEQLWSTPGGSRAFFGISEGGPLFAVECSAQDGLHLFEEDTVHQFWKVGGTEPAEPGELSEHVFTSLGQRTMATWLNFRTRDGANYTDEPCRCGLLSRRMWVRERLDDMVKVRGVNIFASGVEQVLSSVEGISTEFRLVVERIDEHDRITVQVEALDDADHAQVSLAVAKSLHRAIGTRLDVEVREPNSLPKTELKARRWLDLRPKE